MHRVYMLESVYIFSCLHKHRVHPNRFYGRDLRITLIPVKLADLEKSANVNIVILFINIFPRNGY